MASNPVPRKWTIEEYLAYEEETGIKHEYIDGEIYAMSGGTDNHSQITSNCIVEVGLQLRGSGCITHTSDMRVQINESAYVYPDFSVVCGKADFADDNHTMLTNPILVAEVLSPSSESYDRGMKGEFYRGLPSLKHYLLIDQNRVYVQLYTLHDNGWLMNDFKQLEQSINLDAIGVTLPISEVYRDIDFNNESQ